MSEDGVRLVPYIVTEHRVYTSSDIDVCRSCGWMGEVGEGERHARETGPVEMVEYHFDDEDEW